MIYALIFLFALLLSVGAVIYINPGPKVRQSCRTTWLKNIPIAHRGLHTDDAQVPENSLKAFQRAIDRGYAIEIDLLLSADGRVIVFHDYSLKRMTGLDQKVSALPWEQIRELRLLESDQSILLFKDFLDMVKGQVPLLIEVKNEGSVGRLEGAIIEDLKGYDGEFALQAFNPFVLQYFKKHAPDFIRGQLSGSYKGTDLALWKRFLLKHLLMNHVSSPHFVAYQTGTLPKWMANRLKRKGLYLLTWTVKNISEYHRDKALVDNIIFEGFEAPGQVR